MSLSQLVKEIKKLGVEDEETIKALIGYIFEQKKELITHQKNLKIKELLSQFIISSQHRCRQCGKPIEKRYQLCYACSEQNRRERYRHWVELGMPRRRHVTYYIDGQPIYEPDFYY